MGKLKIIKASAGSGKTHTITGEYLSLLMKKERAYRNILAVTFTNKATEEMKRRVIETLYKESEVNPKAKKQLIDILHDYSAFSILTIDRFFQQTLRAFAREIGQNNSYSVELDQDSVLSEAIDNMILNLDQENNSDLLEWLTSISFDAIESGNDWNIRRGIKQLADEIFKESYRLKRSSLLPDSFNKNNLKIFKKALNEIIDNFEQRVVELGKGALEILSRYSLTCNDFSNKDKGGAAFFYKAAAGIIAEPGKRFLEMPDNIDKWVTKTLRKESPATYNAIEGAYSEGLNQICIDLISHYELQMPLYNSAITAISNIGTLGLMIDIERFIKEYTRENNLVLIPETTELLNRIIDGSDTPFIYEKTGVRIDNFMLDEFQDTSLLQWMNFKPLIENSLASGNDNLIVGDVKQSIYRWRGSDWNLLNGDIYRHLNSEQVSESDLKFNWRSAEQIVSFNREFFSYAAGQCNMLTSSEAFSNVYSNVNQDIPDKNRAVNGHVFIKFFDTNDYEDWREAALENISSLVTKYLENGFSYSDIAFLTRTNKEGERVVRKLISLEYPVISEESLLVSASSAVRTVISELKYINNPDDAVNNTIAKFNSTYSLPDKLNENLSLYELCESIVMGMQKSADDSDAIYIYSFLDIVSDFLKSGKTDLSSFLEWWDSKGYKKSVPAPSKQNAIRVMTIHKAKGLGIPVIVLPFFEAELDHTNQHLFPQILWCTSDIKPFDSLPLIPVKYSSSLEKTIFRQDYLDEKIKAYIDNLNVAYVALTRAEREMAIMSGVPKPGKISAVSDLIYNMISQNLDESKEFHSGEWTSLSGLKSEQPQSVPTPSVISTPYSDKLKLSLKGEDFFDKQSQRNYGIIMHSVLSRIITEDDLLKSVEQSVSNGELAVNEKDKSYMFLKECLESVRERHWFDGTFRVYNELEIIEPGGDIIRPDRVMSGDKIIVIDFKFGKKRENSHIRQVQRYINVIRSMGLAYVRGYVWYPEERAVIEVL